MRVFKLGFVTLFFALTVPNVVAQFPIVRSISPTQVQSGATALPITVSGSNFAKNAKVQINGTNLDIIQISWNKLRATVPANLVANPGVLQVQVFNRNRVSDAINLTVSNSPAGNYDWTALNQKLQSFVPGTVAGLTFMISRHGKVIYSQAFGNQTVNTILPIASSTKMPSMLAILTLVDDGLLNLDASISNYLAGHVNVPQDKANITMRMLMNHTSGLSGTDDAPCLNNRNTTLQQCAQEILNLPLAYQPGTRFDYGGNGMQLAGYVAEVISGQSWNLFFSQKVGTPLGLTRYTYTNTQNPRIAGGAFSDVGDYTKFLQSYLAGSVFANTRILSNQTYWEMQTDQKGSLITLNNPGGNRLTGYSYGWWHSATSYLQSQPQPQTDGPELSDQGAFGCTPWIDFQYDYTAILLVNSNTATATVMWNEIRPLIVEQMRQNN